MCGSALTSGFTFASVWQASGARGVVFKSLNDCWICGNPVAPDDRGIDPFGFTVHAECDLKRQEASDPAPPASKPKNPR